jgi:exodeoxyribonuclease V alpha subunit
MTGTHYTLNKRPLIYTGMTRAKKICVFVGQRRALRTSLKREDAANRVTTLAERLVSKCGQ